MEHKILAELFHARRSSSLNQEGSKHVNNKSDDEYSSLHPRIVNLQDIATQWFLHYVIIVNREGYDRLRTLTVGHHVD